MVKLLKIARGLVAVSIVMFASFATSSHAAELRVITSGAFTEAYKRNWFLSLRSKPATKLLARLGHLLVMPQTPSQHV